jgi:NAD(P)-dependent dehydrogenase (short-subunit alcohol dehydrogenase family)
MIIINGASRGIGKFLFDKYIEKGEKVLGTYNCTKPDKYIENYFQVDVRSIDSIKSFIKENLNQMEEIVLYNCAGANYNALAHKVDIDEWTNVININLIGTFAFINSVLPIMREQKYGRIINFSSVVAQKGIPGTSAYSASKSALWGLAKSIASENANNGITINNLNLGYFNIGMIENVSKKYQEAILKQIPANQFGNPQEIYNACEFLRNNNYMNGSSIDINGGLV